MKEFKYNSNQKKIWFKAYKGYTTFKNKKFKTWLLNNNHILLERGIFKKEKYVGRLQNDEIVNLQKQ